MFINSTNKIDCFDFGSIFFSANTHLAVLLILLCLLPIHGHSNSDKHSFKNISSGEGLSNLNVTSIIQDEHGYLWIGTRRGLNRYNGYEFTHFFYNTDDPSSLASNIVNTVYDDNNGRIYIGSYTGLNYYDIKLDKMIRLFPGLKANIISITSHEDHIYVATMNNGVYRFRRDKHNLERIGSNLEPGIYINQVFIDSNGILWVAFNNQKGIAAYDAKADLFEFYPCSINGRQKKINSIKYIYQICDQFVILGSDNGVAYFDIKNRMYANKEEYDILTNTLADKEVNFIFERPGKQYWAGTKSNGLYVFDLITKSINHYHKDHFSYETAHSDYYTAYFIDRSDNIWLGTFDKGIDVGFMQSRMFNYDHALNSLTKDHFISAISKDIKNKLVIATRNAGIIIYDQKTQTAKTINPSQADRNYPYIRSLCIDDRNRYWFGTDQGLLVFDPADNTCQDIALPDMSASIGTIHSYNEHIYIGTEKNGLHVYN
jgi:ligand-binding sensor domain-containing protein